MAVVEFVKVEEVLEVGLPKTFADPLEISTPMVVEIFMTPGIILTIDDVNRLPTQGSEGQILVKSATGTNWSSLMNLSVWFENQLL